MEKPTVYSERMRGHGRRYFFDVRKADNGSSYLSIVSSQRDKKKEGEYKQDRMFIFEEDVDAFFAALGRTVDRFHEHRLNQPPSTQQTE